MSARAASSAPIVLATLPARSTSPFTMAGVSWTTSASTAEPLVEVRTLHQGTWGAWTALDVQPTPEKGRSGTDPAFLGNNLTGIEVRVSGPTDTTLHDLKVTLIDSTEIPKGDAAPTVLPPSTPSTPTTPSAQTRATTNGPVTVSQQLRPSMPSIVTRAQWGATDKWITPDCQVYADPGLQGAIIHHTAGSNDYSAADVPGILRGIQAYHAGTLDWCDIGYNILVDKFGNAYEGRKGSLTQPIHGAHASAGNWKSVGISMMMNSETYAPGAVVYDKVAALLAWRLGQYNVQPATDTAQYNVRGTWRTVPAVAGHREVGQTACPGANIWANMATIRSKAQALLASISLTTNAVAQEYAPLDPVVVTGTAAPQLAGRTVTVSLAANGRPAGSATGTTDATGAFRVAVSVASSASGPLTITTSLATGRVPLTTVQTSSRVASPLGDQTGDGLTDIVGIDGSGRLLLYPQSKSHTLQSPQVIGWGWGSMRWAGRTPDLNGDGRAEILAVDQASTLWVYPSTNYGFASRIQVGIGFSDFDLFTILSDVDGNGLPELLARQKSTGNLMRYPMIDRMGHLAGGTRVGVGWGDIAMQTTLDDFSGDGRADLLATLPDGTLIMYIFGQSGTITSQRVVGAGWTSRNLMYSPGDMTGDGVRDLVARGTDGKLWVYTNNNGSWGPMTHIGVGWQVMRLMP